MGVVGRKPKASTIREAERAAESTPARLQAIDEPVRVPTCPRHLKGAARQAWGRFGREILKLGVMTDADKAALEVLCLAYGRLVDAELKVAEMGQLVEDAQGRVVPNPYLKIAERAGQDVRAWLSEFGMTPASRTRLRTSGALQTKVRPTAAAAPLPAAEPIEDPRKVLRVLSG